MVRWYLRCSSRQSTWPSDCRCGLWLPLPWPQVLDPRTHLRCAIPLQSRGPSPPDGTSPWTLPNGRSKQGLGYWQSECSARRYDRAGRWAVGAHRHQSGCHPTAHGSGWVGWCPERRKNCQFRTETVFVWPKLFSLVRSRNIVAVCNGLDLAKALLPRR